MVLFCSLEFTSYMLEYSNTLSPLYTYTLYVYFGILKYPFTIIYIYIVRVF